MFAGRVTRQGITVSSLICARPGTLSESITGRPANLFAQLLCRIEFLRSADIWVRVREPAPAWNKDTAVGQRSSYFYNAIKTKEGLCPKDISIQESPF